MTALNGKTLGADQRDHIQAELSRNLLTPGRFHFLGYLAEHQDASDVLDTALADYLLALETRSKQVRAIMDMSKGQEDVSLRLLEQYNTKMAQARTLRQLVQEAI